MPTKYSDMTPERWECLHVIQHAGGDMSHDDKRLAPFCDDESTLTDVFNECHNAGWLISRHDSLTDASTVYMTAAGRAALLAGAPVT